MKIRPILFILMLAVLILSGCNPLAPSPPAATPVAVSGLVKGVITAKGSIWVNGTEYQTDAAAVDIDGDSGTEDSLKVGMVVEFNAELDPTTGLPKAVTVEYESGVKGVIDSIDTSAGTLTVLGQVIQPAVTATFEGVADLAAMSAGQFVEASGEFDVNNVLIATRIEVKSPEEIKLKGEVSLLNTTDKTFTLTKENGKTFQVTYTENSGTLSPDIVDGKTVRIALAASPSGVALTVDASDISLKKRHVEAESGSRAEFEGVVAHLSGTDPFTFRVGEQIISVDKSLVATLANGNRVEVRGTIDESGVLVAEKIEVKKSESELRDSISEAKGTITAVDTEARTFTVGSKVYTVNSLTKYEDEDWRGSDPLDKIKNESPLPKVEFKYMTDASTGNLVVLKIERD